MRTGEGEAPAMFCEDNDGKCVNRGDCDPSDVLVEPVEQEVMCRFRLCPKNCLENVLVYYWRAYMSRNRPCSYKCPTI